MEQTASDPRATVIKNVAEDQELIELILKQIPQIQNANFQNIIDLFLKCYDIREEPEFIEAIFNKQEIYKDFICSFLDPLKIKKGESEKNLNQQDPKSNYPYICMQIAKQNKLFYIHLYLKAYFDQKALSLWFQFLKQPNSETIETSLGYLTEVMIPFIKEQFSDCTKICEVLMQEFEESNSDLICSSQDYQSQQTAAGLQREIISTKKWQNQLSKQISILRLFSDELLLEIMNYLHYEGIFKLLHNLILVSLEQNDLKRSKRIFQLFLKKALGVFQQNLNQNHTLDSSKNHLLNPKTTECFENKLKSEVNFKMDCSTEFILQILKEIYDNANTDKNFRVMFFIDSIIRVNLISLFLQRINISPLMEKETIEKLASSTDFHSLVAEEEIIQNYLKSLTLLIKIYSRMTKARKNDEQRERQSLFIGTKTSSSSQAEEEVSNGQNKVMIEFTLKLSEIFSQLPELSYLVKRTQFRMIPYSSGQMIKAVTMLKYDFFQLLYNCLLLSKQLPESFLLDTEKISIFSIIERYLQQNRWNNIVHNVLQKIVCLLIMNNKNFFKNKENNKNNIADEFLNTIIELFTNKQHIFLKSLRFTSQGNLHALYTIAKAIISKMKESYNLANFVHELEYYKKFVMEDLQTYEKRIKQIEYPAQQEQAIASETTTDESDQVKLFIDELSVCQIVKKIQLVNKWPLKDSKSKRKHGSFIHRSFSYIGDQAQLINRKKRPTLRNLNLQQDDANHEHQFMTHTMDNPKNFVGSFSKNSGKQLPNCQHFLMAIPNKTESIESEDSNEEISNSGMGLFGPSISSQQQLQEDFITSNFGETAIRNLKKCTNEQLNNEPLQASQSKPSAFFCSAELSLESDEQLKTESLKRRSDKMILDSDKKQPLKSNSLGFTEKQKIIIKINQMPVNADDKIKSI